MQQSFFFLAMINQLAVFITMSLTRLNLSLGFFLIISQFLGKALINFFLQMNDYLLI